MCRVTDPHTEPFPLFHDVDDDAGDEDDAGGSPAETHRDKCKGLTLKSRRAGKSWFCVRSVKEVKSSSAVFGFAADVIIQT